jgi:hypothetical protein
MTKRKKQAASAGKSDPHPLSPEMEIIQRTEVDVSRLSDERVRRGFPALSEAVAPAPFRDLFGWLMATDKEKYQAFLVGEAGAREVDRQRFLPVDELTEPHVAEACDAAPAGGTAAEIEYVGVLELVAVVRVCKSTFQKWQAKGRVPLPDVRPGKGNGKANLWDYAKVRPALEAIVRHPLPSPFPPQYRKHRRR